MKISGKYTDVQWHAFKSQLKPGKNPDLWEEAFQKFFLERLRTRYFDPIQTLINLKKFDGVGFSVTALQCSLLEFLESTYQGKTYKYRANPKNEPLAEDEYDKSCVMFTNFLKDREPMKSIFTPALAKDFYQSVRCGLLHEARTKNGWKIKANSKSGDVIEKDGKQTILYRNDFQRALVESVDFYKSELLHNKKLQEAFIRKIDGLCK
jgi:hypothetical protein